MKTTFAGLAGGLMFMLVGCGGGGGSSEGGGSPGASGSRAAPAANLSGDWWVTESGVSDCAGFATYTATPYQIRITQDVNDLTVAAPGGTFRGSIEGNQAGWTGSYSVGSVTTTITSMALTVAAGGNVFSGSAAWTRVEGANTCSGTAQAINATRIAASAPVPAAPSALSASASSASAVQLVWNDNSDNETGFKIERRPSGSGAAAFSQIALVGADTTSYTDGGLNALTAYEYRVRASNGAGDSPYSNLFTVTTLAPPPPAPIAPSALALTVNSLSSIGLRWNDNSTNEANFRIERSTSANSGFSEIATVGANATSYQDNGLAPATHYFYRVRASNVTGNSAYSNTADATTLPAVVAPAAPSSLSATASSSNLRIELRWTDNSSNETGFRIERSTNANSGFSQIATTAANVAAYTDTNTRERTRYFYRVRATNAAGNSSYSNTDDATTPRGDDDD